MCLSFARVNAHARTSPSFIDLVSIVSLIYFVLTSLIEMIRKYCLDVFTQPPLPQATSWEEPSFIHFFPTLMPGRVSGTGFKIPVN